MRRWERARIAVSCGQCGRVIPKGDLLFVIQVVPVTRRFVRCVDCAGEAVPDSAPAAPPEREA